MLTREEYDDVLNECSKSRQQLYINGELNNTIDNVFLKLKKFEFE